MSAKSLPQDSQSIEALWPQVTIGQLASDGTLWITNGYAQGTHNEAGKGVPHLRPFNITVSAQIDLSLVKSVEAPNRNSPYWLNSGDILFNNTNSEELVGKVAYFDLDGEFVLSNHMTIIRIKNQSILNGRWLAYLLFYLFGKGVFRALCRRHVNQASISLARLKGLAIPLPPLPEQRAIAQVLRTVQEAREKTGAVIEATKELKKAMMKHLFTYGPVPLEEAAKVPMKETEIGMVPEEWKVKKLTDISTLYTGGTPKRECHQYWNGNIPWIKSGELLDSRVSTSQEFITEEGFVNSSTKYVDKGTILIALYGATAGKVGLAESKITINQAICAIVPKSQLCSEFGFYYLMTIREKLLCERYGGAQPNLSQQIIKNISVPVPPILIQQQIAGLLTTIDQKLAAEESSRQALDALFKTLLHDLMTARIRVKDITVQ